MRHRYDSKAKIGFITPVPDVNLCREDYIPQAGRAADNHGDVWMFCSRGVRELQASIEDHPIC